MRTALKLATVATLATLSACQMMGGGGPGRPSGIEGAWASTDGVSTSTFAGGSLVTTANDTGSRLAEGTYRQVDPKTVSIELTSLIRQTKSNVNCALVTTNQLNCTSSSGSQFVLVRKT
jgi:hypothetical protein